MYNNSYRWTCLKFLSSPFYRLVVYLTLIFVIFLWVDLSMDVLSATKPPTSTGIATFGSPKIVREERETPQQFGTVKQTSESENVQLRLRNLQELQRSLKTELTVAEAIAQVRRFADIHNVEIQKFRGQGTQLIFILAHARSGSTFFGEALATHPAINYHYEPLTTFGMQAVNNTEKDLKAAMGILESLAKCKYEKTEEDISYRVIGLKFNTKNGHQCTQLGNDCTDVTFLHETCRVFPIQLFKIVRIRGEAVNELIKTFPSAKIIYLVRDPRAMYASRLKMSWCRLEDEAHKICLDFEQMCHELQMDLDQIRAFQANPRKNVQVVQYEDIALNPEKHFRRIFTNLGLDWHPELQKYLKEHTSKYVSGDFQTFRISADLVDQWKKFLPGETVQKIEKCCQQVMSYFGYHFTHKLESEQTTTKMASYPGKTVLRKNETHHQIPHAFYE